ncbi:MAG: hypothetical protein LBB59_02710 [Campylobacteraceae bacterium]|nr:hypothetical protein [Campylobacteraceae bacterium]
MSFQRSELISVYREVVASKNSLPDFGARKRESYKSYKNIKKLKFKLFVMICRDGKTV